MKKLLFIRTAVLSASLLSFAGAYSQSYSADRVASIDSGKRSGSAGTVSDNADKITLMGIKSTNEKMFRHFTTHFPNATGIKTSVENKETHLSFFVDGVLNRVVYSKKGQLISMLRYYSCDKLEQRMRDVVNDSYPRYTIFGEVAEVTAANKLAYFVMVENRNSWKRIRIVDGSVDTFEEYSKP